MKKLLSIFSSILIACLFITTLVQATGPKFNYLKGDYKTIRGANFSDGEKDWHDPVEAKIGDVVSWNIYIHNAVEGTVAKNTKVSIELPQKQTKDLEIKATIAADNANEVVDKAFLNLKNSGVLKYLPKTTKLYDRDGKEIKELPDGITYGGITVGDIDGCWPYAVFIVFKTEVTILEDRFLTLDKKVRNLTNAEEFSDSNTASVGDTLEYQITIENPGAETYEFIIKDTLSPVFERRDDTLLLYIDGTTVDSIDLSAFFDNTGSSLYLNSGSEIRIIFKASISNRALIGSSFKNTVFLYGDKTLTADVVTTIVPRGSVLGAATLPVTGSPITLSLALAFVGTSIYYLIREEKLFKSALIAVRTA